MPSDANTDLISARASAGAPASATTGPILDRRYIELLARTQLFSGFSFDEISVAAAGWIPAFRKKRSIAARVPDPGSRTRNTSRDRSAAAYCGETP